MQPLAVVALDRNRDLDAGMSKAEEQGFVEQFFAHATIEALAEAVLHRPARRDVMRFQAHLTAPCQHSIAGEFGAVAHWEAAYRRQCSP